jgi:hypothetical protein
MLVGQELKSIAAKGISNPMAAVPTNTMNSSLSTQCSQPVDRQAPFKPAPE